MCPVWIWEQTAIISLYNINWPVFITQTESVYFSVRTETKRNSGNAWPLKDPKFSQNLHPVSLSCTEAKVSTKLSPRQTVANCQSVGAGAPITAPHLHTSCPAALSVRLPQLRRQSPIGTPPGCTNCTNRIFSTHNQWAQCKGVQKHKSECHRFHNFTSIVQNIPPFPPDIRYIGRLYRRR